MKKYKMSKLRPREMIYSTYWEFHKGDEDCVPSVPHGHSLDGKLKLKIWTGEIYDVQNGQLIAQASKKDMMKLYNNKKFQSFVYEVRETYKGRNPRLPDLEGFESKKMPSMYFGFDKLRMTKHSNYKFNIKYKIISANKLTSKV